MATRSIVVLTVHSGERRELFVKPIPPLVESW